jgi:hypothetical protein
MSRAISVTFSAAAYFDIGLLKILKFGSLFQFPHWKIDTGRRPDWSIHRDLDDTSHSCLDFIGKLGCRRGQAVQPR